MALIDVVKRAQTLSPLDAEGLGLVGLQPSWTAASDADASDGDLVAWRGVPAVSPLVKQREEQEQLLIADLKSRSDDSLSLPALDGVLRSYLEHVCSPNRSPTPKNIRNQSGDNPESEPVASGGLVSGKTRSPDSRFTKLLKDASPRLGQKLLSLILRAFVVSRNFNEVEAILDSRAVSGNIYPDLVPTLVQLEQPALLCVWIRNVCDPKFSDLVLIIKYFLSSTLRAGSSLARVRSQWQKSASEATQRLSCLMTDTQSFGEVGGRENGHGRIDDDLQAKKMSLKEDVVLRAVVLSTAVANFQPYELCLHHLVSAGHDESVLSLIFSQLENREVLKLLRYLKKWLEQYSKRGYLCGFYRRREDLWSPLPIEVLQWTTVLLDAHMMTLSLCPDFHPDIQSVQLHIKGLVEDGHKFAALVGVVEHLRDDGLLPTFSALGGKDEHVIEYLDI